MTRPLIAACLALAGCAAASGSAQERTYLCDGGRLATISISGDAARVRVANEDLELRHVASASGARYSSPRAILHTKDDEALLAIDGRELGPCQEVKRGP
jgi:membrane-bound inhibitor of C-type lysozyme